MSVSRSLKPFIEKEPLRPPDWFSQKSCAMQYASLLENADTPKRKKRESGETTSESIVRRLTQERITELSQTLACQKEEYLRLKADINLLKSGAVSDEKLEKMWLEIQQEERETDQKTRAHMAWLTKRQQQQKQEMSLSPIVSSSIANQTRKHAEGTMEVAQPELVSESTSENDDERKNNRGGRSPLLTSLLKSPSPTTQAVQTYPSTPVQVSSPTITSLLGSNSKILNAQLTQNVSPQLQQLVSTAIASANATSPPSVGAPTLSMLLEMPATTQRGPLPKLQTTTSVGIVSQQQQAAAAVAPTASTEMHKFEQTIQPQSQIRQMNIQNEVANAATVTVPTATISAAAATVSALTAVVTAPTNVPVSENMVQIIDHIDDVLRKDIMADVMDKDEINEIIGDIEELIKEEITGSPQTLDTSASTMTTTISTAVISNLSSTPRQTAEIPIVVPKVEPKPEPRDVDETVSLSDSPRSEMAIEEIDSSTSNIAEIIGTVAIEPQEPKIIVAEITEIISNTPEEIKSETSACDDERVALTEELVPELETNDEENSKDTPMEEKQSDIEIKSVDTVPSNVEVNNSKLPDETKEAMEDTVVETEVEEEDGDKEEETEVITHDDKESSESVKELKESPEDTEGKNNARLDQLEIHLAKITGDQQDVPSTEVVSVSSEVTNDLPSTEDTEKSQDISLILEDDESSQNSENKKKAMAEEQIIENTVESTESLESFKEDSILMKEKTIAEVKEESSVKSQEEEAIEETLEIYTDEFKKEEVKDSSEDTTSSILQDAQIKEEEIGSEPVVLSAAENASPVVTVEEVKNIKNEPIEVATADVTSIKKIESAEVKPEEPKTKSEINVTDAFCTKSPLPPEEDKKEIVEMKQEKEDTKKNVESEQSIKKEIESTEEPVELDEEESSLSKLSGGRAMKTYSKKQNITVDSEPENEGTGEGADYRAWKKAVMLVYNRLATHKYASVFLRPITEDQAPGYHSVIFRPMDLSTIKKNIDNGTIRSTMHFQRDVMLMFQNAIMYNKHDTFIYKMAVSMQEECLQHMQVKKIVINRTYIFFFFC